MQTKKNHQTKKGANQVNDLPPKTTKSKIKSSPGKMNQSENYKNITESTPPPWIGWRPKTL